MNTSNYPRRKFGLLMACTTAFVWGTLALFIKYALNDFGPTTIIWFRFSFAFITLGLFLKISGRLSFSNLNKIKGKAALCGLFLAANYHGYAKGVELSGAATTQILIQSASVFFVLAGVFIFKERMTLKQWLGVLCAITGIFLFSAFKTGHFYLANLWSSGTLYLLYSGLTWGFYAVIYKIVSKESHTNDVNLLLFAVAAIVTLPGVNWADFSSFSTSGALVSIYLGMATVVAYGTMGAAIKHAPVAEVSMIITSNPVITLAVLYLLDLFQIAWIESEPLGVISYLGAILTIVGVIVVVTQGSRERVN